MIRILCFLLMIVSSSLCFAENLGRHLNVDGLTEIQKAEMLRQIETLKQQSSSVNTNLPEPSKIKQYAELGEIIGGVIKTTAKEVGVAANEFVKTPVGKITMALIVWTVAGEALVGVVFGVSWLCIMIALWIWFFKRICVTREYEFVDGSFLGVPIRRKYIKKSKYDENENPGTKFLSVFLLVVIVAIGFISIFA